MYLADQRIDRSCDMHKGKLKMELKLLTSSTGAMVRTKLCKEMLTANPMQQRYLYSVGGY